MRTHRGSDVIGMTNQLTGAGLRLINAIAAHDPELQDEPDTNPKRRQEKLERVDRREIKGAFSKACSDGIHGRCFALRCKCRCHGITR